MSGSEPQGSPDKRPVHSIPQRISWHEAHRLTGDDGPAHESGQLSALLALATAPAPGRDDAAQLGPLLAAFRDASSTAGAPVAVDGGDAANRARVRPRAVSRTFWVRCAAAVLAVCGVAEAAAHEGMLPDPIQRIAHEYLGGMGIPRPSGPAGHGNPESSTHPTAAPRAGTASATPIPTTSGTAAPGELVAACGVVAKHPSDWQAALDAAARKALISSAGGERNVMSYCSPLAQSGEDGATAPPKPTTAPSAGHAPSATTGTHGTARPSHTPVPDPHSSHG